MNNLTNTNNSRQKRNQKSKKRAILIIFLFLILMVIYVDVIFLLTNTKPITVAFETFGAGKVDPIEYINEEETVFPNLEKDGYVFDGWYIDEEYTQKFDSANLKEDLKVYAKWNIDNYSITYVLNGGTNSVNNPSVYNKETETIILECPQKENFDFLGWYDNADASGNEITDIEKGSVGNIVVYAKWVENGNDTIYGIIASNHIYNNSPYPIQNIVINRELNDDKMNFEYKYQNEDDSKYTTSTPIEVGSYTVKVTVYDSSEKVVYYATSDFEIEKADYDMSNAKWNYDKPYKYNSEVKTVDIEGLPNGVEIISYLDNNKTEPGKYTAKVELDYDEINYNKPIIPDLEWEISFAKLAGSISTTNVVTEFVYNGNVQSISNATGTGEISYEKNSFVNAGLYEVTINSSESDNYLATSKKVIVNVAKASYDMENVEWDYISAFTYDGTEKQVKIIGLPSGITVDYYVDNAKTDAGNYTASVSIDYDEINYNMPTDIDDLEWVIEEAEEAYYTEDLKYTRTTGGYAVALGNAKDKEIVIPSTYNGQPVVSVADSGFQNSNRITSVTLPDSITKISRYAFQNCRKLKSITFSKNLQIIEKHAFDSCCGLFQIELPESLVQIDDSAFQNCCKLGLVIIERSSTMGVINAGNNIFAYTYALFVVIDVESEMAYRNASGWSDYADMIYYCIEVE